jgi:hypothetical protein
LNYQKQNGTFAMPHGFGRFCPAVTLSTNANTASLRYSVRRDEILSPPSSWAPSSPDLHSEDDQQAQALLGKLLDFDTFTVNNEPGITSKKKQSEDATREDDGNNETQEDDQEQEFEFRLFSAPAATTNTKQTSHNTAGNGGAKSKTQKLRIRVRSPTPADIQPGDGRFVVPFRGWQYYVTRPELMKQPRDERPAQLEDVKRTEYEQVAVTGAQLMEWARITQTPGCHLPWRVTHLKLSNMKVPNSSSKTTAALPSTKEPAEAKKNKSKPGKKRRVILRKRAVAAAALAGMTDAEKRNKKNREKKIKRRQKERDRKAALALPAENTAGGGATAGVGEDSGSE